MEKFLRSLVAQGRLEAGRVEKALARVAWYDAHRAALGRPAPGPGVVFWSPRARGPVRWLVQKVYPDDQNVVLVVPVDDETRILGAGDVEVAAPYEGDRWVARLNWALWAPTAVFTTYSVVARVSDETLDAIDLTLALMVRGLRQVEPNDPGYAWIVRQIRREQRRVEKEMAAFR